MPTNRVPFLHRCPRKSGMLPDMDARHIRHIPDNSAHHAVLLPLPLPGAQEELQMHVSNDLLDFKSSLLRTLFLWTPGQSTNQTAAPHHHSEVARESQQPHPGSRPLQYTPSRRMRRPDPSLESMCDRRRRSDLDGEDRGLPPRRRQTILCLEPCLNHDIVARGPAGDTLDEGHTGRSDGNTTDHYERAYDQLCSAHRSLDVVVQDAN